MTFSRRPCFGGPGARSRRKQRRKLKWRKDNKVLRRIRRYLTKRWSVSKKVLHIAAKSRKGLDYVYHQWNLSEALAPPDAAEAVPNNNNNHNNIKTLLMYLSPWEFVKLARKRGKATDDVAKKEKKMMMVKKRKQLLTNTRNYYVLINAYYKILLPSSRYSCYEPLNTSPKHHPPPSFMYVHSATTYYLVSTYRTYLLLLLLNEWMEWMGKMAVSREPPTKNCLKTHLLLSSGTLLNILRASEKWGKKRESQEALCEGTLHNTTTYYSVLVLSTTYGISYQSPDPPPT